MYRINECWRKEGRKQTCHNLHQQYSLLSRGQACEGSVCLRVYPPRRPLQNGAMEVVASSTVSRDAGRAGSQSVPGGEVRRTG